MSIDDYFIMCQEAALWIIILGDDEYRCVFRGMMSIDEYLKG